MMLKNCLGTGLSVHVVLEFEGLSVNGVDDEVKDCLQCLGTGLSVHVVLEFEGLRVNGVDDEVKDCLQCLEFEPENQAYYLLKPYTLSMMKI